MLPRDKLPQIPSKEVDNFRKYAQEQGVDSKLIRFPVMKLKPIQKHLNKDKVKNMVLNGDLNSTPLIISDDNYILDGHHRWAAEAVQNRDNKVVCLQFNAPITELLELGHLFGGSTVRSVEEITIYSKRPRSFGEL